jgi:NADH:flavin oxidoreductases, Old Yellow Enzyme family
MEDAIGLHRSFHAKGLDVRAALDHYESARREDVEKTQHAAEVSLVWFEDLKRFWNFPPLRFVFGLMTRSKAITYDNLALRAPELVAAVDNLVADELGAEAKHRRDGTPVPPMFQPFTLRGMKIENRAVVSPMCQYSAENGLINDWHVMHYGARAAGGAGLIFTEMVCVSDDARITPGCAGIYTDAQEAAWKRIVDFAHRHSSAKFALQLGHAGRKGATKLMWEGMDRPLSEGAWPIISASPLPYYPESQVPREMTRADMDRVKADFVAAAKRGSAPGSICSNSTARTATCWRVFSRRSPIVEPTNTAAASRIAFAIRWKCSRRCVRSGRRRSRCPSASRRRTGRRAACRVLIRSRSPRPLRKRGAT